MILRARQVVPMEGAPIENGAVVVEGSIITEVGRWSDLKRGRRGEVLDLGECALLPGLINAHCHLDYTGLRGTIPRPASFTSWIRDINERKAALSSEDYLRSIGEGFAEAARFGTTTILNLEAFPELLSSMPPPLLRTWWFAEFINFRTPCAPGQIIEELRRDLGREGWLGGFGLAPHAPYTASAKLYQDVAERSRTHQLPVTTHLAESAEEKQMFGSRSGPLFELMEDLGRSMDDCGGITPLALLLRMGVMDERWIVAHLNELPERDLAKLSDTPKFHIVHCPRSHRYFGHEPFRMEALRDLGFNICVGTDSLASNNDLSLFSELRHLADAEPALSARELIEMVTVNAARALHLGTMLGQLIPGGVADLAALPVNGQLEQVYEEVIAYEGPISWMMVNGQSQDVS